MADTEPLLFRAIMGALRPMSGAAEDALKAIPVGSVVRIEIKRTVGNIKRMAWYWVMLKIALDNLEDAFDGPMTTTMLHKWLKRQAGLAVPVRSKKTNEIIDWDYDSISFHTMPENQRSEYINFAADLLAKRLGVDPMTLQREALAA